VLCLIWAGEGTSSHTTAKDSRTLCIHPALLGTLVLKKVAWLHEREQHRIRNSAGR